MLKYDKDRYTDILGIEDIIKRLKKGQDFHFDNEKWCTQELSDDLRFGWITWNERFQNFAIHFNGVCIHTSKTFGSAKKRLKKLMFDWNCEFKSEDFIIT